MKPIENDGQIEQFALSILYDSSLIANLQERRLGFNEEVISKDNRKDREFRGAFVYMSHS